MKRSLSCPAADIPDVAKSRLARPSPLHIPFCHFLLLSLPLFFPFFLPSFTSLLPPPSLSSFPFSLPPLLHRLNNSPLLRYRYRVRALMRSIRSSTVLRLPSGLSTLYLPPSLPPLASLLFPSPPFSSPTWPCISLPFSLPFFRPLPFSFY